MAKYILKRVLNSLVVIFISMTAVFFVVRLLPANIVDPKLPLETQKQIMTELGLDRPKSEQFADYLGSIAKGDFGKSIKLQKNVSVTKIIADKAKVSLQIGVIAIFLSIGVGVLLGVLSAVRRGKVVDHIVTVFTVLGISIPSIAISILLQYFFAVKVKIFPIIYTPGQFASIMTPIIALSFWPIAQIARFVRNEFIDVLNSEYILLVEAKGVDNKAKLFKHALRNAVIPSITVVGPLFVSIITGSLIVEKVFAIPGLGNLLTNSITMTDYPIIQAMTILFSTLFTMTYLLTDILYGIIDPRIRVAGGRK